MRSFEAAKWYDNNLNNDNLRLLRENLSYKSKSNNVMLCKLWCDDNGRYPPPFVFPQSKTKARTNCARSFIIQITGSETNDLFFQCKRKERERKKKARRIFILFLAFCLCSPFNLPHANECSAYHTNVFIHH